MTSQETTRRLYHVEDSPIFISELRDAVSSSWDYVSLEDAKGAEDRLLAEFTRTDLLVLDIAFAQNRTCGIDLLVKLVRARKPVFARRVCFFTAYDDDLSRSHLRSKEAEDVLGRCGSADCAYDIVSKNNGIRDIRKWVAGR